MTTPISSTAALLGIPQASQPTRIEDAAQQFESLLIHQMMQSAWEAEPGGLGGDDEDDSQGSVMRDLACQQFARLLAKQGGIGLTRLIVKGLSLKGE
jgi:Rod binding domain-containing protein